MNVVTELELCNTKNLFYRACEHIMKSVLGHTESTKFKSLFTTSTYLQDHGINVSPLPQVFGIISLLLNCTAHHDRKTGR